MEDLRKIRPVISFIVENYEEVFAEGVFPMGPEVTDNSRDTSAHHIYGFGSFSFNKSDNNSSSSMIIDTTMQSQKSRDDDVSVSSMDESVDGGSNNSISSGSDKDCNISAATSQTSFSRNFGLVRPNLLVVIPTNSSLQNSPPSSHYSAELNEMNEGTVHTSTTAALSEFDHLTALQQYTDAEWNVRRNFRYCFICFI